MATFSFDQLATQPGGYDAVDNDEEVKIEMNGDDFGAGGDFFDRNSMCMDDFPNMSREEIIEWKRVDESYRKEYMSIIKTKKNKGKICEYVKANKFMDIVKMNDNEQSQRADEFRKEFEWAMWIYVEKNV